MHFVYHAQRVITSRYECTIHYQIHLIAHMYVRWDRARVNTADARRAVRAYAVVLAPVGEPHDPCPQDTISCSHNPGRPFLSVQSSARSDPEKVLSSELFRIPSEACAALRNFYHGRHFFSSFQCNFLLIDSHAAIFKVYIAKHTNTL